MSLFPRALVPLAVLSSALATAACGEPETTCRQYQIAVEVPEHTEPKTSTRAATDMAGLRGAEWEPIVVPNDWMGAFPEVNYVIDRAEGGATRMLVTVTDGCG